MKEVCSIHGYKMWYDARREMYYLDTYEKRGKSCPFCEEIFNLFNELSNFRLEWMRMEDNLRLRPKPSDAF